MRILLTIPHYFHAEVDGEHGSQRREHGSQRRIRDRGRRR